MARRYFRPWLIGFVFLLLLAFPQLQAEYSSPPQTYSITEINSMMMQGTVMKIYRDGSKALIDQSIPPSAQSPKGFHTRTLYDLQAQRSFTLDLINPSTPCGAATFSGDWGDPFATSAQMTADLAKQNPKVLGKETVNGIATKAMEIADPSGQGKAKVWLDEKYGLIIKWQMVPPSGPVQTMVEVKQFSPAKPPASVFALPAACAEAAAAPPPLTESQEIAAATGGNAEDFADAIMPPPSRISCTVLFRIVRAGTMEPITSGFQVGLDTTVTQDNPGKYAISESADGRVRFSGGGLHEVTGQMPNGVLRIDNPPPQFNMLAHIVKGGESEALIYRQCFRPETVLLLVVNQDASKPSHWLWVKSGKFATVSAAAARRTAPSPQAGGQTSQPSAASGAGIVTSMTLSAEPAHYTGPCPGRITFTGTITTNAPGRVPYEYHSSMKYGNGQNKVWPGGVLIFTAAGTQSISKTITFVGDGSHISAWLQAVAKNPNVAQSEQVPFLVDCGGQ